MGVIDNVVEAVLACLDSKLGSPIIAVNKIKTENAWINEILQTSYV